MVGSTAAPPSRRCTHRRCRPHHPADQPMTGSRRRRRTQWLIRRGKNGTQLRIVFYGVQVHRFIRATMKAKVGDLVIGQPIRTYLHRPMAPFLAHACQVSGLADDGQATGEDAQNTGTATFKSHTGRLLRNLLLHNDRLLPASANPAPDSPQPRDCGEEPSFSKPGQRPACPRQTGRTLCSPFG